MSNLRARIKKIEQIQKARSRTIAFIWAKSGESEEEAIKRTEAEGKDVILIMWAGDEEGPEGPVEPIADLHKASIGLEQEIQNTVKELQSEGLTLKEIESLLNGESSTCVSADPKPKPEAEPEPETPGAGEEINALLGRKRKARWSIDRG